MKTLFALVLTLAAFLSQINVNAQKPVPLTGGEKILWIGNSFSDWCGPVSSCINSLCRASGINNVQFTTKGKGMGILKEYCMCDNNGSGSPMTILNDIRTGDWDIIVVQTWEDSWQRKDWEWQNCNGTHLTDYMGWTNARDTMVKYAQMIYNEGQKIGAKVIVQFPHIGVKMDIDNNNQFGVNTPFNKTMTSIKAIQDLNNMYVMPSIKAFDSAHHVFKLYYNTDAWAGIYPYNSGNADDVWKNLYGDGGHQNSNGMALEAYFCYTILTGRSPIGLDPTDFPPKSDCNGSYTAALQTQLQQIAYAKAMEWLNGSVANVAVTSVSVTPSTITIDKQQNTTLTATIAPANATNKGITWTSSNTSIATVTSGVIKGISAGNVNIIAKTNDGNFTDTCVVTVTNNTLVDNTAPSAPTNLKNNTISDVGCTLSWNASTDNIAVTGYDVYQGTNLVATTVSTNYTISGLTPGNTYTFKVYAKDAAGNVSASSNTLTVTTQNATATNRTTCGTVFSKGESLPNNGKTKLFDNDTNTYWMHQQGNNNFSWIIYKFCSNNKYAINRYTITTGTIGRRDWDPTSWILKGSNDSIVWTTLDRKNGVTFTATSRTRQFDILNNSSFLYYKFDSIKDDASDWLQIAEIELYEGASIAIDTIAPSAPTNLSSSNNTSSTFTLSWTASTDNIGVTSYTVYKNGTIVGTTVNTSLSITGLTSATTYGMTVRATDLTGNISPVSSTLNVTTANGAVSVNDFIPLSFGGLVYRLFIPKNYKAATKYPLVTFLHGAGERGNNNTSQLNEWPLLFAQDSNQVRWPSFVLVPQCPSSDQWVNTPWANGSYSTTSIPISTDLTTVNSIIEQLKSTYSLDTNRLYVTGLSMGGYGTWDFITRFPNKFAAAIPICGAGDPSKAALIKKVPIRFYHSADDAIVPVSGSRDMNTALTNASATDAVYKEYNGLGHGSWTAAYKEPGLLPWMFGQTKSVLTNIDETLNISKPEIYPNPVNDFITIKQSSAIDATITLTDLTGKILLTHSAIMENEIVINLSNLASGAYILNIVNSKNNYNSLIIKK